jgi:ribonuclease HI
MSTFKIFIDGSCEPNPGVGGWGLVLVSHKDTELSHYMGGELVSTNNRMETAALIAALELSKDHKEKTFHIFSDSKLVCDTYNTWMHSWAEDGIVQDKANPDLVQQLIDLHPECAHIKVEWIKGHAGHKFNELADALANAARKVIKGKLLPEHKKHKVKMKTDDKTTTLTEEEKWFLLKEASAATAKKSGVSW